MANGDATVARLWLWARKARATNWEARFAEELPRVYNFFRYRVGPGPVAEDLTSITFEKAWKARDRYREDRAGFETWLFAVARNVAIDHFRSTRVSVPIEDVSDLPGGPTPEEIAERRSNEDRLGALLLRRTERERELLALKYGAEFTNREIARLTGLSESNVGTILHRAVEALRAEWEQEGA
ncbi:MAG TPA: sigma-70 family RNA polymerase sigma factor [Candidatus Eisenbacteria bacterium]|nr:sigma-70 family RNA polymerase sigma factor [Candidatus Eisenbacteria bacterium]